MNDGGPQSELPVYKLGQLGAVLPPAHITFWSKMRSSVPADTDMTILNMFRKARDPALDTHAPIWIYCAHRSGCLGHLVRISITASCNAEATAIR